MIAVDEKDVEHLLSVVKNYPEQCKEFLGDTRALAFYRSRVYGVLWSLHVLELIDEETYKRYDAMLSSRLCGETQQDPTGDRSAGSAGSPGKP
jgi:hypothetical protein